MYVRLGICLPQDATFDLIMYTYLPTYRAFKSAWTEVDSIAELDGADLGDRYFWMHQLGMYFKSCFPNLAFSQILYLMSVYDLYYITSITIILLLFHGSL